MAKFVYTARTADDVSKRANQQGGSFDVIVRDGIKTWNPKAGDHMIRILPPTFEGARHYGMDVYLHSNIGTDNQTYLCLEKMGKGPCPICQEALKLANAGEDEAAKKLKPYRRVLMYVVPRALEKEGPKVYTMPWTLDRDISLASVDPKTKEALLIDHPIDGYDVSFRREGGDEKTKYIGVQIDRRTSMIIDDENTLNSWLDFITNNPLDKILNFYSFDHIAAVFRGASVKKEEPEAGRKSEPVTRAETRAADPAPATAPAAAPSNPQPRAVINDASAPLDSPASAPAAAPAAAPSGGMSLRDRLRQQMGNKTA